ncbi:MAG: leucine-rich repeat domain-containing protein [Bacillus subtilis]|nr:leucine-rich repeat domain-containing protein [Bacillus subtilis]
MVEIGQAAFRNCLSPTSIDLPDGLSDDLGRRLRLLRGARGGRLAADADFAWRLDLPALRPSRRNRRPRRRHDDLGKHLRLLFVACARHPARSALTKIDFSAFSYCASLETIVLPESLATITFNVFHGCEALTIFAEAEKPARGVA